MRVSTKGVSNKRLTVTTQWDFRHIFLTCRDNKEQQINVELHFQSWDISVLIPNPYRCFQIYGLCAFRRGRAERNCSPALLRTVPTKPERRQKLSFSIISSERKPPLVRLSGRTARNETHVCPTQCPLCGVVTGSFTPPPGCSAALCGRLNISAFPEMRGRNPAVTAGAGFYTVFERYTGNL